jgi:hypothetical protein
MLYKHFVNEHASQEHEWDGDLLDLNDSAKDEAVSIFLDKYGTTWYDDIDPASFTWSVANTATHILYKNAFDESSVNSAIKMLVDAQSALAPSHYGNDEKLWSHALGDITKFRANSYAQEMKNKIYLYLEDRMRDMIQETFDRMFAHAEA